jgi:hypothetical protein
MDSAPLFDEPAPAISDVMQREGWHLTRQKFQQDAQKLKQLLLSENIVMDVEELELAVQHVGFNLSAPELRVVAAIYKKLGDTNFQGNTDSTANSDLCREWRFDNPVPRLRFDRSEFLKLYGIRGKKDCHEAEIAFKALVGITRSFRIVYRRRDGRTIVTHQPLIGLSTDYGILTQGEIAAVIQRDIFAKAKTFTLSLTPIWVDEIGKAYLYRPISLYQEIRDAHGGHRCRDAVYLFHDFVLTFDLSPVRINVDTLEHRLWLDRHRKHEQPGRVTDAITDALETAVATRLLSKYEFDNLRAVHLYLNPERCKLFAAKKEREERRMAQATPAPYLSGKGTTSVGE